MLGSTSAAGQARPDTVDWRLADTVWVYPPGGGGCCYSLRAFRIAVRSGTRWDTLSPVSLPPAQLGDGTLLLRVVTKEQQIVLQRYSPPRHSLTAVRAPTSYNPRMTLPVFFAPRTLLAYAAENDTAAGIGYGVVVRQWPGWKLVAWSPEIEGCGDTLLEIEWNADGTYVRWYPPKCTPETPSVDSIKVP